MAQNFDLIQKSWNLIADFVCWEFCRNSDHILASSSPDASQIDLMSYFRDMVVKMTTKRNSTSIPKCEILAKFLEELSYSVSSLNFESVLQYVPLIKENCPELVTDLNALLKKIQETCENNDVCENKGLKLCELSRAFSSMAFKCLPLPDLLQICNSHVSKTKGVIVNEFTVTQRLMQERDNLLQNVGEVLRLCKSNTVYEQCLVGKKGNALKVGNSDLDHDEHDLGSTRAQSNSSADEFLDCASQWSDSPSPPIRRHITTKKVVKSPPIRRHITTKKVVRSPPTRQSQNPQKKDVKLMPKKRKSVSVPKKCRIVLSDVATSRDPYVQYLYGVAVENQQDKRKGPLQPLVISSDSDDDFELPYSQAKKGFQNTRYHLRDKKREEIRRSSRLQLS